MRLFYQPSRFRPALSRFPRPLPPSGSRPRSSDNVPREIQPSADDSPLWHTSQRPPVSQPADGLRRLLSNNTLVIERQIEMLNILVGFEQANKYSISNEAGESLGFIAEESSSLFSIMARQTFSTHRPFKAIIMDPEGSPVLWLRRPFAWINSRMFVQRLKGLTEYTPDGDPVLDTFAEAQQSWHLWRRRYDLFIREEPGALISTASEAQPEPDSSTFQQFARVDSPFAAWDFGLLDAESKEIAYISRAFRGLGREIFTDTGQYFVRFGPSDEALEAGQVGPHRELTLDERALVLALAINIDFDYFSHHSDPGSDGLLHTDTWDSD